jgi:hypothetical protein
LYRKHFSEFQCQRCKTKLHSRVELDRHAESPSVCHPRARHLNDGFTFETWLILHNKKKSFQGQDEEDRWREIYLVLFPLSNSIPELCIYPIPPLLNGRNKETNWTAVSEVDSKYIGAPSVLKENISLEEFGNIALPQEFRERAAALVNDTMRPLEMQLFDQVPNIIQDSQEVITEKYQQLLNTDFSMTHDLFITSSSSSGAGDSLPTISGAQNTKESTNNLLNGHWTLSDTFGPDPFADLWISPNANQQLANGHRSPDSGFISSVSCSCIGVCICQGMTDRQPRTPQFSRPGENPSQTKVSKDILSFLQSIKGSISAIEKSLQVPDSMK